MRHTCSRCQLPVANYQPSQGNCRLSIIDMQTLSMWGLSHKKTKKPLAPLEISAIKCQNSRGVILIHFRKCILPGTHKSTYPTDIIIEMLIIFCMTQFLCLWISTHLRTSEWRSSCFSRSRYAN